MKPSEDEQRQSGDEDIDSADEALLEMLGLLSPVDNIIDDSEELDEMIPQDAIPKLCIERLQSIFDLHQLAQTYATDSICILPKSLSVPAALMRRLTEELVWGKRQADRTYESIQVVLTKDGSMEQRKTLTRLENFVTHHDEWKVLCNGYIAQCISALMGEEMVLYKEKLNLKPPGGAGFAPHLDTPSLRVALGKDGPQTFVTVMVAIDNMSVQNGCLRVVKGPWTVSNQCEVVEPEENGNPDAGGRAGALVSAESLDFEDIVCQAGTVVAFSGFTPHRSSCNTSAFPRRAVFLTYNPKKEGDFHARYYERMEEIRNQWRDRIGLGDGLSADEQLELDALKTIPSI
jgi:ectoine hydroxylase-related dioxygenase (phytanoyl-CoA dioxygenase family)